MINIIDIETTGLRSDYHEIIEIAIIQLDGDKVDKWSTKIAPKHIERAHPRALEINGYDSKSWRMAPLFEDVAHIIERKLSSGVVVGHNVKFDIRFLNEALFTVERRPIKLRQIDTVTLAFEHLYPIGLESLSMDSIRDFLRLSTRRSHTALKDAEDVLYLWRLLSRASRFTRFKIWLSNKIRGAKNG